MGPRYIYGFSSIWTTWSLDRLFTVDEVIDAAKQKNKTRKISDNRVKTSK